MKKALITIFIGMLCKPSYADTGSLTMGVCEYYAKQVKQLADIREEALAGVGEMSSGKYPQNAHEIFESLMSGARDSLEMQMIIWKRMDEMGCSQ